MKRRGILAALLAVPFAALSSTALALGRRRRNCEPSPCYGGPHRVTDDVTVCATLKTGTTDEYTIRVTANVSAPPDTGPAEEPGSYGYSLVVEEIKAKVIDTRNNVLVLPLTAMNSSGGGAFYLDYDATLGPNYVLKAIVQGAHMVKDYTAGYDCP